MFFYRVFGFYFFRLKVKFRFHIESSAKNRLFPKQELNWSRYLSRNVRINPTVLIHEGNGEQPQEMRMKKTHFQWLFSDSKLNK